MRLEKYIQREARDRAASIVRSLEDAVYGELYKALTDSGDEAIAEAGYEKQLEALDEELAAAQSTIEDLSADLATANTKVAALAGELARVKAAGIKTGYAALLQGAENMANDDLLEAINDLVTPDNLGAWDAICAQVNGAVDHASPAGRSFYKVVEAVDQYRRFFWPENFPSDDSESMGREERDAQRGDLRMEEARDRERDAA